MVSKSTKRWAPKRPKTAAEERKLSREKVSHPRLADHVEEVDRVVDTISAMHKRGQIGDAERRAAETYRCAFDIIAGSIGGVMDPDRVFGAGTPGSPPPPHALEAGDTLNEASRVLGQIDGRVVELVVGQGLSVTETARQLMGARPSGRDQDHIGRRLRMALQALSHTWHGGPVPMVSDRRKSFFRAVDARPVAGDATSVARGRSAHASRGKICETH